MKSPKRIFIYYKHFFPGYRAGGPIQSLTNLVLRLQKQVEIYVITSAYDMQSPNIYPNIQINAWNKVSLSEGTEYINVWYSGANGPSKQTLKDLIREKKPDCIYLNGIFLFHYVLLPLIVLKSIAYTERVVICPRGMLQQGALDDKALKKNIYISVLRFFRLVNNVTWHATNQKEKEDITQHFPKAEEIIKAENIPKIPFKTITFAEKLSGEIKLIYLSLIAEKKNLLFLLQVIKQCKDGVSLEIYGPPKDLDYWHKCKTLINAMPNKVKYMGDANPINVQQIISSKHVFVLPTKGENFGHAIYESLSVGRPVITSYFTPWNELDQHQAGINIDITNAKNCISAINKFAEMGQTEYNSYCKGAHQMAVNYFNSLDSDTKYHKLFKL